MTKAVLLAAAAGMVLSACGPVVCACMAPAISPGPHDLVVSETVHAGSLKVGQRLQVQLNAYSGMTNWGQIRSSDAAILAPINTPGVLTTSGTTTFGFFTALEPGEADVTSTATPNCSPGQACPALAALYTLKVTVTS